MQGSYPEAAAEFEQAARLQSDFFKAEVGAATCHLIQGDYRRGWPAYEARLKGLGFAGNHNLQRWSGEPLAGKTLLVTAEQGLGDTIQFVRYARALKAQGARVVLAVQRRSVGCLAGLPDVDELFLLNSGRPWPQADFHLPLLSVRLPSAPTKPRFRLKSPILRPILRWPTSGVPSWPARGLHYRNRLARHSPFCFGTVAFDSAGPVRTAFRAAGRAAGQPAKRIWSRTTGQRRLSARRFFRPARPSSRCLHGQRGDHREPRPGGDFGFGDRASGRCAGRAGLGGAAILARLALAAAREDSPWYPTMRLFRQTTLDDWPDVFRRIAEAVQTLRAERRKWMPRAALRRSLAPAK